GGGGGGGLFRLRWRRVRGGDGGPAEGPWARGRAAGPNRRRRSDRQRAVGRRARVRRCAALFTIQRGSRPRGVPRSVSRASRAASRRVRAVSSGGGAVLAARVLFQLLAQRAEG